MPNPTRTPLPAQYSPSTREGRDYFFSLTEDPEAVKKRLQKRAPLTREELMKHMNPGLFSDERDLYQSIVEEMLKSDMYKQPTPTPTPDPELNFGASNVGEASGNGLVDKLKQFVGGLFN